VPALLQIRVAKSHVVSSPGGEHTDPRLASLQDPATPNRPRTHHGHHACGIARADRHRGPWLRDLGEPVARTRALDRPNGILRYPL